MDEPRYPEKTRPETSRGQPFAAVAPTLSLPKGGGAIRSIGEKFAANPATGTATLAVPIATSRGREGFGPQLSLTYDSGSGNGAFGLGWSLSLPSISRKTDKGLPRYLDAEESDVFILSGAEDLVPAYRQDGKGGWAIDGNGDHVVHDDTIDGYGVRRYRPRVEGSFARIERWTRLADPRDVHWRSISPDNVLTVYGGDAGSRVFDPQDASRIFSWLICESRDDKGNAVLYRYKAEDGAGIDVGNVSERNRGLPEDLRRTAQRYLKRIHYGNRLPLLDGAGQRPRFIDGAQVDLQLSRGEWMFETVLDYGEHDADAPLPGDGGSWACRFDPFSVYRPGFEVRTLRRCQRLLMFHHFDGEEGVGRDCLVQSTDLTYADRQDPSRGQDAVPALLTAVTHTGYRRAGGGYDRRSLPPVEFDYSRATVQDAVHDVDAQSLANLPVGADGIVHQWIDLHGEGIPGLLTEQADAWFYKRNLSPLGGHKVEFAPVEIVAVKPNVPMAGGPAQFIDLEGDGQAELVVLDGPAAGFHEHDGREGWRPYRPFASRLSRDLHDANLRFVDLDGDGRADVLVTEDDALVWHACMGRQGFGPAARVARALDEETGPRLVFADDTDSIHLADLSGDGLADLVRIRNGEVCYWPNLGYGRFGAKVAMDDSPRFDHPDQFDPKRLRLADIDGSGTADIVYLHRDGVRLYFNRSGNGWSAPQTLRVQPRIDDIASIASVDLLGNGTACLVWSSPLPGDAQRRMRYVDLMDGRKPHLLVGVANNLGAETRVHYAPSTRFYLQDRRDGRPWLTKLPFPVHVVEKVETFDHVSRSRFATRYAYHHGCFDAREREFRGFGMVERWDTEQFAALAGSDALPMGDNVAAESHVPPVYTRTWFHTGIDLGRNRASDAPAGSSGAAAEYFREPGLGDDEAQALLLPAATLPPGLCLGEEREACRALKGAMLRQEVYALDGTARQAYPYGVTQQSFAVRLLQPMGGQRHAVFFTYSGETLSCHYERNPADPRVQHALTLEVDAVGNVLKSAAVGYGRRASLRVVDAQGVARTVPNPGLQALAADDQAQQTRVLATYTENRCTGVLDAADAHRAPLPCETSVFELTGYAPSGPAGRFRPFDLVEADPAAPGRLRHVFDNEAAYEEAAATGARQRRLIERVRTLYRRDDLTALLALGEGSALALPGEAYRLAFTPGLLAGVFQRALPGQAPQPLLPAPEAVLEGQAADRGGYVSSRTLKADGLFPGADPDGQWWVPSGRSFFSSDPGASPAAELAQARRHFFLPRRYSDPFGNHALVAFDAADLLPVETHDALGNRTTVEANDYRVLQPRLVSEPNRNQSEVAFDALGMVVGTAVMGKPSPAPAQGDSLAAFAADLTQSRIDAFHDGADPRAGAAALLQDATTRIVYDIGRFQRSRRAHPDDPTQWLAACSATLARETHAADAPPPGGLTIQVAFSHSDGFGREVQKKIQAEPGPVADGGPTVAPRWVGSGWTVFDNKGLPVRRYEPFFSATHRFEFARTAGVSPIVHYDPLGRAAATLHPDHTWEKVAFDAWRQETWDAGDTVGIADPATDPDVGSFFSRLPSADYLPTWLAARSGDAALAGQAAIHAGTFAVAHADSLGRTFLTVAHNRFKYGDRPASDQPVDEFHATRTVFDIEGHPREVIDAKGRIVMRYAYDMLGNRIHQLSMEAGARWMLGDVAGKPIRAWDSRDHRFATRYDALRRPTETWLQEGAAAEQLIERTVYGESRPNPEADNLRGKVVQVFDQAGVATSDEYDFKGNLLRSSRQLASAYSTVLDWSAPVPLDAPVYAGRTRYDALDRPVQSIAPHSDEPGALVNVTQPVYNEANLLEQVDVWLGQAGEPAGLLAAGTADLHAVTNIDYDAKGQRLRVEFGNGAVTSYGYDPATLRLTSLRTQRGAADLQNLGYSYDPAGNITHIRDDAQQTIFFRNKRVEPSADYRYDALYRLIEATGREHLGQAGGTPFPSSYNDSPRVGVPFSAEDGTAMARYLERYVYDAAGNFLSMKHVGTDPANPGWERQYVYDEASLIEAGRHSNRLTGTSVDPLQPETYSTHSDGYDAHGNMLRMPHLQEMRWDFKDQLRMTRRQKVNAADDDGKTRDGERTWHVYDASGQRVRKVTELTTGVVKDEHVYLGDFEIYREAGANPLMRETLHMMANKQRIALVEARTAGNEPGVPQQFVRYQSTNHLGSAALELDDSARILSYEEYTPYGSTSYRGVSSRTEAPNRYRYTGKEKDEESGLYYHGARYYAAWLGRWTTADPAGLVDGLNLYRYLKTNPITHTDPTGMQEKKTPPPNAAVNREIRRLINEVQAGPSLEYVNGKFVSFYRTQETVISAHEASNGQISNKDAVREAEGRGHIEAGDVKAFAQGLANGPVSLVNEKIFDVDPHFAGAAVMGEELSKNLVFEAATAGFGKALDLGRPAEAVTDLTMTKPKAAVPAGEMALKPATTEEAFAGLVDTEAIGNEPAVIARLEKAEQFDVGGYKSMTGKGQYGRFGDGLDSDEALQNAFVRNARGVGRNDALLLNNPAMALSPQLHHSIRNLTTAQIQGRSAVEVLQLHLNQMRPFTPDFALVVLERESLSYIRLHGL